MDYEGLSKKVTQEELKKNINKSVYEEISSEYNNLGIKILHLGMYLDTQEFFKLSLANKTLLRKQLSVMKEYSDILNIRLELLEKVENNG